MYFTRAETIVYSLAIGVAAGIVGYEGLAVGILAGILGFVIAYAIFELASGRGW